MLNMLAALIATSWFLSSKWCKICWTIGLNLSLSMHSSLLYIFIASVSWIAPVGQKIISSLEMEYSMAHNVVLAPQMCYHQLNGLKSLAHWMDPRCHASSPYMLTPTERIASSRCSNKPLIISRLGWMASKKTGVYSTWKSLKWGRKDMTHTPFQTVAQLYETQHW